MGRTQQSHHVAKPYGWVVIGLWASIAIAIAAAWLAYDRVKTETNDLREEYEFSFDAYRTSTDHLSSLVDQRLFLLARSLGMQRFANEKDELTLISLAAEWQRIANDFYLSGDFYFISNQGEAPIGLVPSGENYTLQWNMQLPEQVNKFFSKLDWTNEGQIYHQAIQISKAGEKRYLVFTPVYDRWSRLAGWMVNQYDQAAINDAITFVGRPSLVEKSLLVNRDGWLIQGTHSQETQAFLSELVDEVSVDNIRALSGVDFTERTTMTHIEGEGLLLIKVVETDQSKKIGLVVAVAYYSFTELFDDMRGWLGLLLGICLLLVILAFVMAYMYQVVNQQRRSVQRANALRIAAFEGRFSQFVLDEQAKVLSVNQFHAELLGQEANVLQERSALDWQGFRPDLREIIEQVKQDGQWLGEVEVVQDAETTVTQQMTVRTATDIDGSMLSVWSGIDISEQKRLQGKLDAMAYTDMLTGTFNRRYMEQQIETETKRYLRHQHVFSLIIIDLDNFKALNDEHGHDVGDACLVRFAETINTLKRDIDVVCRWGGEEFLLLLPDTDAEQAWNLAERIRIKVSNQQNTPRFTCSAGVVDCQRGEDFDKLYKAADEALYRAKSSGRNQVVLASAPSLVKTT